MPPPKKILVSDPDPLSLRRLAPLLRQRGWQVHTAPDGSRALQIAILRSPDLILFDERTPLLDARTFLRILRANPRTDRIPVILTGESADPAKVRVGAWLKKPYDADEVLSRLEQVFRRSDAARAATGEGRELEGNLAQIPLVDLLQILSVNRKTGRLRVEREGERGEVALSGGQVVDAQTGTVAGEKALFRMLARREGQFSFHPGPVPSEGRISRRLDELLLEGLRQADELARLLPALPSQGERLELFVAASEIPPGLHPVTAEVVRLLETPRSFAEVLDGAGASDLEAARALSALLEHGYATRREGEPEPVAEGRLLAPHVVHALRARIGRARARGAKPVGKVILAGGDLAARRSALARFATLPGWEGAPEDPTGFGTVGRLDLGEVRIDLLTLPADRSQRPLWRPFAGGAVGTLVLLPAVGTEALLLDLTRGLRLPVVVSGPREESVPTVLRDAPGGMAFEGSDPAEALRALLAGAGVKRPAYSLRG
jgi:DNA-binding response OmpR family regulator